MPFAYMDDGAEHIGKKIHSTRVPFPNSAAIKEINDFVIMHYQFTDWKRMESKHRWYQCFERIQFPEKSAIEIFRRYNHMYQINEKDKSDIPNSWFNYYSLKNIQISNIEIIGRYYWDGEVEKFINRYGKEFFKYIDLENNSNILLRYLRGTRAFKYSILERAIVKLMQVLK